MRLHPLQELRSSKRKCLSGRISRILEELGIDWTKEWEAFEYDWDESKTLAQNWVEWKRELPAQGFAIYAVALFMLGMWVWRAGMVQRLEEYRPVLKSVCVWCIPAGLVLSAYVGVDEAINPAGSFRFGDGLDKPCGCRDRKSWQQVMYRGSR